MMYEIFICFLQAGLFALCAFALGYVVGANHSNKDGVNKLNHLQEVMYQEIDRFDEARRALNRTTTTILASMTRTGNAYAPLDDIAVNQLNRRVRCNSQVPGYEGEGDGDPANWGHYVSHPDEHGYITPMGLTQDADEGRRWLEVGEEIRVFTRRINQRIEGNAAVRPHVVVPQIMMQKVVNEAAKEEEEEEQGLEL